MTTKEALKILDDMPTAFMEGKEYEALIHLMKVAERFENSLDLGEELTTNLGVYELYAIPKEQSDDN